jgi:hypothetical protein
MTFGSTALVECCNSFNTAVLGSWGLGICFRNFQDFENNESEDKDTSPQPIPASNFQFSIFQPLVFFFRVETRSCSADFPSGLGKVE